MTTVRPPRANVTFARVEGKLLWALLVGLVSATPVVAQQDRPGHWLHAGAMPPGAIGAERLLRGGPLSPSNPLVGYCQPVELRGPRGARIGAPGLAAVEGEAANRVLVGLQIGLVYRFQVTQLPNYPGVEVFPTVELVDRLHPPPGKARQFPVPVELTLDELLMAADGKFVTRIIYVEDPLIAAAVARKPDQQQPWVEAPAGHDPLVMARALGRPIAILRMGGRVPEVVSPSMTARSGSVQPVAHDEPALGPRTAEDVPRPSAPVARRP